MLTKERKRIVNKGWVFVYEAKWKVGSWGTLWSSIFNNLIEFASFGLFRLSFPHFIFLSLAHSNNLLTEDDNYKERLPISIRKKTRDFFFYSSRSHTSSLLSINIQEHFKTPIIWSLICKHWHTHIDTQYPENGPHN